MTLSTHVLDATTGTPAEGLEVLLERDRGRDGWVPAAQGHTGPDGRLRLPDEAAAEPGIYRITFGSGAYFRNRGTQTFYPQVTVTFEVTDGGSHYHVPLLLSPFAYSTYRGS